MADTVLLILTIVAIQAVMLFIVLAILASRRFQGLPKETPTSISVPGMRMSSDACDRLTELSYAFQDYVEETAYLTVARQGNLIVTLQDIEAAADSLFLKLSVGIEPQGTHRILEVLAADLNQRRS